jgi:hypothetical protein
LTTHFFYQQFSLFYILSISTAFSHATPDLVLSGFEESSLLGCTGLLSSLSPPTILKSLDSMDLVGMVSYEDASKLANDSAIPLASSASTASLQEVSRATKQDVTESNMDLDGVGNGMNCRTDVPVLVPALACDGTYLYCHGSHGLSKLGSGYNGV